MLLAKTKSMAIMLRARTPLRPRKISVKIERLSLFDGCHKSDHLHARGGSIVDVVCRFAI